MEEWATQTKEEHEARDQVSLHLARAARSALRSPEEDDNRPPHMRG